MIQAFADWLIYKVFSLSPSSHLGSSLNFFVYDSIKILLFIFTIVSTIAFIRTFFPPQQIKKALSRQHYGIGNLVAAIFGAITPFCSCSSVPIFIGMVKAEVPLGIAFSFLVTSPLVNEIIFVMMGGTFGWKIAIFYALFGILLGWTTGIVLGRMGLEKELVLNKVKADENLGLDYLPKKLEGKIQYALNDGFQTFRGLWKVVLVGMAIGAYIHGYVPAEFFTSIIDFNAPWAVPLVTLLGIPIYAGCSTMVPIIFAFTQKGIPLGTGLAFLMAVAGLSLPEGIMLSKVLSPKLLTIFFTVVGIGIIMVGYLFNFLAKVL
jgi:uncharacterized membrane protein YraQ (UPF0718 family)